MSTPEPQSTRVHTWHRSHRMTIPTSALTGLLALAVLATACGSSSSNRAGTHPKANSSTTSSTTGLTTGPTAAQAALVATRPFTLHVPPGLSATRPAPLLVMLHGFGATGAIEEAYLKLTPAADAHGVLYAYADGTPNPMGRRFWNATNACCDPSNSVDDSAYITAVIAEVNAKHMVDSRRVFLVGHSNGGFMSYRMACEHSDEIAAIVSIAGATWQDPSKCTPKEGVAILEVHGTADQTIKFAGGASGFASYPSATTTVETWAGYNGCAKKPDRPAPAPRAIEEQLPPATVTSYSTGCKPNGDVELWTQPNGVHIPPFSPTFAEQIVTFLLDHPKR